MTLLQRIKQLCASKKMTIAELERKMNFSQGSIRKWDDQPPSVERLKKVADYFGVSADYLLGRTEKKYYILTENEKRDIAKEADDILSGLSGDTSDLNFYGEPATPEQIERIRVALRTAMEMNKEEAKKKFTPKKYRQ